MARKTLADIDPKVQSAIDEFKDVSEIRFELATDAYNKQDAKTRQVIDRMVGTLRQYATDNVTVKVGRSLYPVKIDNDTLGWNLLYLATEIVKDLAFMQIRVANYEFPAQVCAMCGVELTEETRRRVKRRG